LIDWLIDVYRLLDLNRIAAQSFISEQLYIYSTTARYKVLRSFGSQQNEFYVRHTYCASYDVALLLLRMSARLSAWRVCPAHTWSLEPRRNRSRYEPIVLLTHKTRHSIHPGFSFSLFHQENDDEAAIRRLHLPHLHNIKLLNSKFIWNKNRIIPQLIIC